MLHVSLGDFHQVGDQVVTSLELNINLRKRILESVSRNNQTVVNAPNE